MKKQRTFSRVVKISGKIGLILSVAHLLGPFAWKGVLVGLAIKEHITLKNNIKIKSSTPFHLYDFSDEKQTSFIYYDLTKKRSVTNE